MEIQHNVLIDDGNIWLCISFRWMLGIVKDNTMQDRERIRKECIAHRESLSPEEVHKYSLSIATSVFSDPVWRNVHSIALYASIKNEVSTDTLLRQAWQEGKQVMLPRCIIGDSPDMKFFICRSWKELVPSSFGILEPDQNRCFELPKYNYPDLVIAPAVALTVHGDRLGYGRGYYDALFSKRGWENVKRIALIYSTQLVVFDAHEQDVPMHGYVTEVDFVWL